jgi:spore germination cell wall hydrolase CwlJ-like protein
MDRWPDAEPVSDAAGIDVLARTLWGEARGEGAAGMAAVAAVIVNRLRRPARFGHDVAAVCQAARQFSCWNEGDANRAKLLAVDARDAAFAAALRIARRALAGALADPVDGACHYHAAGVAPRWARGRAPCAVVGRHFFYNDVE